jgi:hypothetical protein
MYSAQGGENEVYKQAKKPNSDLRPSLLFGGRNYSRAEAMRNRKTEQDLRLGLSRRG